MAALATLRGSLFNRRHNTTMQALEVTGHRRNIAQMGTYFCHATTTVICSGTLTTTCYEWWPLGCFFGGNSGLLLR